MISLRVLITVAAFSFLVCTAKIAGQEPPTRKRPTVGLVLSGGGARGFAHIGALKALEENHIPVDYIGGASMGGLIGALYAMGKTPAEIEQIVVGLDWDKLLQSSTSFENLSYRRKEDRRNIPSAITLKGRIDDLRLPNALNSGHEIGLLISDLTLRYESIGDFSLLPIPFQTVGTDMVNGESVTLKSGSLSRSLRATMSMPGVFAPVEIDGRILSDGGLVNNIPTNLVKAMGADIVLVINIETQLGDRDALKSLPGLLMQTINIATVDNSRRSLQQADLIVAPELGNFSSTDFSKARELIDLGYSGTADRINLLRALSLDETAWQQHLEVRRRRQRSEKPPIASRLAIDPKDEAEARLIRDKLEDKYVGKEIDESAKQKLAEDLSELVGTGRFDALGYRVADRNGEVELVIGSNRIPGVSPKPTRLEIGLDVNSIESDNLNFNFLTRLTIFDVGGRGAEWRNDFRIGSDLFAASEYFRPIRKTKFFLAPHVSFEGRRINVFNDGNRLAEYAVKTFGVGLDAGYSFNSKSELRAGYSLGYQSASRRIGDPLLPELDGMFSTFNIQWNFDSLDRTQVPTKGVLSRNSLNYYFDSPGSTERFAQAATRSFGFVPISDRNTLFAFGGGATSFGKTASPLQQFTLGGPFRLGGYSVDEFRASNSVNGGVGLLYNPKFIPAFLGGKTYLGAWYEAGSIFERLAEARYRQSVSGGVVVETPLGPVFLGGGFNENGRGKIYFSFGRFIR
ncbi:MAG: patatin-like phospholipase family protein [Pyrinomonadaceae bacterium]